MFAGCVHIAGICWCTHTDRGVQATPSPTRGNLAVLTAIFWGTFIKSHPPVHFARHALPAHSDTSELSAQLTVARVSARKVRFRIKQPVHGGVHSLIDSGTPSSMLQASITRGNRPGRCYIAEPSWLSSLPTGSFACHRTLFSLQACDKCTLRQHSSSTSRFTLS